MSERKGSKLELDDEGYCKICGVPLPWLPVIVFGYERCPECILEETREELYARFGSTKTSDIIRQNEYDTAYEWYIDQKNE